MANTDTIEYGECEACGGEFPTSKLGVDGLNEIVCEDCAAPAHPLGVVPNDPGYRCNCEDYPACGH